MSRDESPSLEVCQAPAHDVYRDVVRIPEAFRVDRQGRRIREGSICWIEVRQRRVLAWVRGSKWDSPCMTLDELLRRRLGIQVGETVDVRIRKASLIGEIRWGLQASEAAYRIATLLGLLSVVLGVVSVAQAFGVLGLAGTAAFLSLTVLVHYFLWRPKSAGILPPAA